MPGPPTAPPQRRQTADPQPAGRPRTETLADRYRWLGRTRDRVSRLPGGRVTWKVLVGVVGALVVAGGVLLLPLPGPGWLVIFAGLGVWAIEFAWAGRLLAFARRQVAAWSAWVKRQPRWRQLLIGLAGLVFLAAVALGAWWLLQHI